LVALVAAHHIFNSTRFPEDGTAPIANACAAAISFIVVAPSGALAAAMKISTVLSCGFLL
jgi:hypothetical protein